MLGVININSSNKGKIALSIDENKDWHKELIVFRIIYRYLGGSSAF